MWSDGCNSLVKHGAIGAAWKTRTNCLWCKIGQTSSSRSDEIQSVAFQFKVQDFRLWNSCLRLPGAESASDAKTNKNDLFVAHCKRCRSLVMSWWPLSCDASLVGRYQLVPAACVQRKYNLGHSSASTKEVWQSYMNSVQQSATRISHALESIV